MYPNVSLDFGALSAIGAPDASVTFLAGFVKVGFEESTLFDCAGKSTAVV
jgi:hypothetical protein